MQTGCPAGLGIARLGGRPPPSALYVSYKAAPLATFALQSSHRVPRYSARSTAPARSFSPKPFRIFSPMSIAMVWFHTLRSAGLSCLPHSGAIQNVLGYILRKYMHASNDREGVWVITPSLN